MIHFGWIWGFGTTVGWLWNLSIFGFWYPWWVLEPGPTDTKGGIYECVCIQFCNATHIKMTIQPKVSRNFCLYVVQWLLTDLVFVIMKVPQSMENCDSFPLSLCLYAKSFLTVIQSFSSILALKIVAILVCAWEEVNSGCTSPNTIYLRYIKKYVLLMKWLEG